MDGIAAYRAERSGVAHHLIAYADIVVASLHLVPYRFADVEMGTALAGAVLYVGGMIFGAVIGDHNDDRGGILPTLVPAGKLKLLAASLLDGTAVRIPLCGRTGGATPEIRIAEGIAWRDIPLGYRVVLRAGKMAGPHVLLAVKGVIGSFDNLPLQARCIGVVGKRFLFTAACPSKRDEDGGHQQVPWAKLHKRIPSLLFASFRVIAIYSAGFIDTTGVKL